MTRRFARQGGLTLAWFLQYLIRRSGMFWAATIVIALIQKAILSPIYPALIIRTRLHQPHLRAHRAGLTWVLFPESYWVTTVARSLDVYIGHVISDVVANPAFGSIRNWALGKAGRT